jgi:hypothetical protein
MAAQCEQLVASGRGDDLVIVPWWQPDPAKGSSRINFPFWCEWPGLAAKRGVV